MRYPPRPLAHPRVPPVRAHRIERQRARWQWRHRRLVGALWLLGSIILAVLLVLTAWATLAPPAGAATPQWGTWRTPAGAPGASDDQTAAEVPITDAGGYYTAAQVEAALAELWTAKLLVPRGLVSDLGSCVDGTPHLRWVTNALTPGDCATGTGTTTTLCRCEDGAWTGLAGTDDDVPESGDFGALQLTGDVTSIGLATTIAANAVALGTDTTGGYAASSTEAGPATTATALAANGANCSAGAAAGGSDTTGAAEDCTTYVQPGAATTSGLTVATDRILGRDTAGTGAIEEIPLGSGLSFVAGALTAAGGIGGSLGSTDRAIAITSGTGGATLQGSTPTIDANGRITTGTGTDGGIAFGSTSRISDSNNDGRIDFFAGGSSRMDILNNGEVRMLSASLKFREVGSDRYVGTSTEYFVFGGGNGSNWSTEGSGGAQHTIGWFTGDYTSPTRSRGLRIYRSVEVSTSGSGSPNAIGTDEPWRLWTNEGATAEAHFALPSAAAGYSVGFCVQDADGIQLTAAAGDTIRVAGTVTSAAGSAESATIGDCLELIAINATEWVATSYTGTWTLTP